MFEKISARDIAVTGLKAQRIRMNVIANNIANAQSTRMAKTGQPFRRQMAVLRGEELGPVADPDRVGVRVKNIVEDKSPFKMMYDPNHPLSDEKGYVAYPNVDLAVEMVDLVSAQRAYEANLSVVLASRRMSQAAQDLIA